MDPSQAFLAAVLSKGARALAGYASSELLASTPEAKASLRPDPFAAWQGFLAARLEELAAAAAAERPQLFVDQVQWARMVHTAREVPAEHLRASLEALRRVLAKELPAEHAPLATAYLDRALAEFEGQPATAAARLVPDTPQTRLASEYLLALLEGDRLRAGQLILEAAEQGQPVEDLYLKVLAPALVEVGRMWLTAEITVAEEHFASATTRIVMAQLRPYARFRPRHGKTLLATAVTGNLHDLGIQMVADFFEMDGWRVILLGANTPLDDLVQAVEFYQVDLLGLSVALPTQLPTLQETIDAVRRNQHGACVKILVGGCALRDVANLAEDFGADGCAADPLQAVALGNRLVGLSS